MSTTITFLRIKRAIEKSNECFLCDLETEIERKYLDNYLSELVMDAKARQQIIVSRGFCNQHSFKLLIEASKPTISDGHGIALIMQSVTEQLIQDITEHTRHHNHSFREMLVNEEKCPACTHIDEFLRMYLKETALLLSSNKEFSKLFIGSKGLCVPHFVTMIRVLEEGKHDQSQNTAATILEVEKQNLQRVHSELSEYVRRQSYEFSERERASTANILLRSVEKLAGRRGIKTDQQTHGVNLT